MSKEGTAPARLTLLDIANKYGSTAKIPPELILKRSDDGKTVLLHDGTKVSDALIKDARAAADRAAAAEEETADRVDQLAAKVAALELRVARLEEAKK